MLKQNGASQRKGVTDPWSSFYNKLNTESEKPQKHWKYVLNMNSDTNPEVQVD